MTIWVLRGGELVEKYRSQVSEKRELSFPTPMLSRMEPYESPIDGREITSWRERDKDLRDSNSYDPRDMPVRERPRHERPEPASEQLSFRWTEPD